MTPLFLIDTVRITLDLSTLPTGIDYIGNINNSLTKKETWSNLETNQRKLSGDLRNFKVDVSDNRLVIRGSFSRYLKGNNITPLTRDEIKETIKTMSTELKVPIDRGRITRIDLAEDFFLSKDVMDYIDLLKSSSTARVMEALHGKYFITTQKTLVFYDKHQHSDKDDPLPVKDKTDQRNMLRYELRLQKEIKKFFKISKPLRVAQLYSTTTLKKLAKIWFDNYTNIQKDNQLVFPQITNLTDIKNTLMYDGLTARGGIKNVLKWVDQASRNGNFKGPKKATAKRFLKKLNQGTTIATSSELVKELDLAIANSKTCKFLIS